MSEREKSKVSDFTVWRIPFGLFCESITISNGAHPADRITKTNKNKTTVEHIWRHLLWSIT